MSDEDLAPQEREWLANPEATVREALGDTVGDGEGLDERVFDALIARAKAEAWEEGYAGGYDFRASHGIEGAVANPYKEDTYDHP